LLLPDRRGRTISVVEPRHIPRVAPVLREWWPAILIVIGVVMLVRK
jgi:hypothetical protein